MINCFCPRDSIGSSSSSSNSSDSYARASPFFAVSQAASSNSNPNPPSVAATATATASTSAMEEETPSSSHTQGGGTSSAPPSSYGRVVKLHFSCRAQLPMGSSLRVTSSQLWAPTNAHTNSDPSTQHDAMNHIGSSSHSLGNSAHSEGTEAAASPTHELDAYASSVEMVTSPDTYPIWKTRTPVVVSLGHHVGSMQLHRYRYLVVTPGLECATYVKTDVMEDEDGEEGVGNVPGRHGLRGSTSHAGENFTQVMCWEDPFQETVRKKTSTVTYLQKEVFPNLIPHCMML